MTVRELIEELRSANQDALVVMSQDPEGNGFSPLDGLGEALYGNNEITDDWDVSTRKDLDYMLTDAVVLWPL